MKKVYRVPAHTLVLADNLKDAYDAAVLCLDHQADLDLFAISVDGVGEINVSEVTTDEDIDEMFRFLNISPNTLLLDASKVLCNRGKEIEDYDPWADYSARECLRPKEKKPLVLQEQCIEPVLQLLERIDKLEKEINKLKTK